MIHLDGDTVDINIGEQSDCTSDSPLDDEIIESNAVLSENVDIEDISEDVDESDLGAVKNRMEHICGILSNWTASVRTGKISKRRDSLVCELQRMVTIYYGYSDELADYFLKLFSPVEAIQFFEANERPLPMTLRVNTLKTRRRELAAALISRGANVDPAGEWTKEGLVVHSSRVPIGATPEYLAGHYMLQSAASLIPVLALSPKEGEKILDIAAAPGGKTTHIAQLMNNSGVLFANDVNKERCKALVANIHRLGIKNTIVTNCDGVELCDMLPPLDRVLCDAPCSGLGVISRDPSIKVKRTIADQKANSELQKKLLCASIDMVTAYPKSAGIVVYSTCSLSVEENEQVVDYALRMRDVKLVPLGLEIGSPGLGSFRGKVLHPSITTHTRRFYPHLHNLDGFFVAKFVKLSNRVTKRTKKHREPRKPKENKKRKE